MHLTIGPFLAAIIILLTGCSGSSHPAPPDSEISAAISQSDDYAIHQQKFITASKDLIINGTCTLHDLQYMGGWVKASEFTPKPVYFTFCGKMDVSHRVYLDVSNGYIFK